MVEKIKEAMTSEKLLMYFFVFLVGGGGTLTANSFVEGSSQISSDVQTLANTVDQLVQVTSQHDAEIRDMQVWQARTDADRYTSKDARLHSESQSQEFGKVYAEISSLRRDMLSEQRKTGELQVKLTEQLAYLSAQINEMKKIVALQARNE